MVAFIAIIIILLIILFIIWLNWDTKIDPFFYEKKFYVKLNALLKSIGFKLIMLLIAGFSAYITFCLGNEGAANSLKKGLGQTGEFLLENGGWFIFLTIIIPSLYGMLNGYIASKCIDNNLEEKYDQLTKQCDITIKVLEQLEKVVIEKRQLLAYAAKDYNSTPQTPKHKTVFDRITQPEKQIKLLIESLHDCVKSIYPNEFLKVALVSVRNGQLDDWICHSPYNTKPRTTIDQLRHVNSTFSRVLSMKKMIIVADTKTEIKKPTGSDTMYIQGNTDPSESWCQVCVPIHSINTNETIFIISIAIKAANVISPENEKFLEWLFKFFISRLALEHSLKEIKERISK
ncbi:hypothetical protein [Acinetobacter soli]|uniref:hypothetical protein n=1 Tax=Acinetobacter soli TaxID=487316 RepID=UPI000B4D3C39|nr:hypothetical protein [Acinetobacter soli]